MAKKKFDLPIGKNFRADDFIREWWKLRFPDADSPIWSSAITCADASDLLWTYRKFAKGKRAGG